MKKFTITEALEDLCMKFEMWAVYISFIEDHEWPEICKAAPFLVEDTDYQLLTDGRGVLLCESEKEAYKIFDQIVGDDGPTETNLYNGPANVYALVIGPDGMETENT